VCLQNNGRDVDTTDLVEHMETNDKCQNCQYKISFDYNHDVNTILDLYIKSLMFTDGMSGGLNPVGLFRLLDLYGFDNEDQCYILECINALESERHQHQENKRRAEEARKAGKGSVEEQKAIATRRR
jgi:hypothetical protein